MNPAIDPIDYTTLALTLWREARGETDEGRRAVCWVIRNRRNDSKKRWPNTWYEVCTQPYQFSCFNANDRNAVLWPNPKVPGEWDAWLGCRNVVEDPGPDPTKGANHYHVIGLNPKWADPNKITCRIGRHVFYKL